VLLSMYVVKFCLEWEVTVSMPNIYKGDDMPLASAKRGYVNAPVFTHELFPRHDTALTPCLLLEHLSVVNFPSNSRVIFPMDPQYGCSILIIILHCTYRSQLELVFNRATNCSSYCFYEGSSPFFF